MPVADPPPPVARPPVPPGPRWPAFLQTLVWVFRPISLLTHLRRRYGDTFTVRFLALGEIVMTSDPAEIRKIFAARPDQLHAGEANMVLSPVVGDNSVLVLDEDRHLRQRRLLLPPFHGDRMRAYLDEIEAITDAAIDNWPERTAFKLRDETQMITMDVILRVVFGITEADRRREFRARMNAIDPNRWFKKFALLPLARRVPSLERRVFADFTEAKHDLDSLMIEEIHNRRAAPGSIDRQDILSMLLQARDEDGNPMTDDELRDELVTLVIAGHETTATSLAWAFELMLRHPAVWARVRAESVAGASEYVDAVVKESLRTRPILPIVARVVKEPFEVAGYEIPVGRAIAPNIYLAHYREASYPDAESFKPERFLGATPEGSVWLPFGGGVRRCIGASFALYEMRVVIQTIARRVDLRLERDVPERIVRRAITFAPANDVPVIADVIGASPVRHSAVEAAA
ncbi:MAG: cytochrome P450 [Solirubrobacterales bacterium]